MRTYAANVVKRLHSRRRVESDITQLAAGLIKGENPVTVIVRRTDHSAIGGEAKLLYKSLTNVHFRGVVRQAINVLVDIWRRISVRINCAIRSVGVKDGCVGATIERPCANDHDGTDVHLEAARERKERNVS